MRTVLYAPIVHHLKKDYSEEMVEGFRQRGCPVEEACAYADKNMKMIREKVRGRKVDKLYLDSFMWSGEEAREVIMENSHKHVSGLALEVIDSGAEAVAVDRYRLCQECIEYAKMHTFEKDPVKKDIIKVKLLELIAQRDAWMADEINDNLGYEETGLLVIGTGHMVHDLLKGYDDLEVELLLDPEKVREEIFKIDPNLI